MPALFVSHGSPMIVLDESPARAFLESLGPDLPRPTAILVITAHFEATEPTLTTAAKPAMIYDFGGFPEPLYRMTYPAPGGPDLAAKASSSPCSRTATRAGTSHSVRRLPRCAVKASSSSAPAR
ncbi:MAG: extradiol-type ring-opening dioxygenase [Alphaproteobacteria bacterium]|nr:MAG: extradiol-type ring-opening dioxygenase [Alphaproteobacteria bacterium]